MSDTASDGLPIDRAAIMRRIERLDLSADVKALLSSLVGVTIDVGGRLIDLGARVMAFIFDMAKAYPGVAFGIVAALVLSFLISAIPVVGPLISPILTPLLLIIGVTLGALNELTDGGMRRRLEGLSVQLNTAGVR